MHLSIHAKILWVYWFWKVIILAVFKSVLSKSRCPLHSKIPWRSSGLPQTLNSVGACNIHMLLALLAFPPIVFTPVIMSVNCQKDHRKLMKILTKLYFFDLKVMLEWLQSKVSRNLPYQLFHIKSAPVLSVF